MTVTLIKGEGLAAKDRNLMGREYSSDPYVVMELQTTVNEEATTLQIGKSKTLYKTLSPEWNETFTLEQPVSADALMDPANPPTLVFRIFDYDFGMTADDAMGVVTIPITELSKDSSTTEWYEVPASSAEGAKGKIQVAIESKIIYKASSANVDGSDVIVDESKERPSLSEKRRPPKANSTGHDTRGKVRKDGKPSSRASRTTSSKSIDTMGLKVIVHKGEALAAMDRNIILGRNTTSDPYVIVELQTPSKSPTDQEDGAAAPEITTHSLGKTKVSYKTLNPSWEETFTLENPLPGDSLDRANPPSLVLKIFDYDFGMTADDNMGVVTIPIESLSRNINTTEWYEVPESSASGATGKIQVSIETTVTFKTKDGAGSKKRLQKKSPTARPGENTQRERRRRPEGDRKTAEMDGSNSHRQEGRRLKKNGLTSQSERISSTREMDDSGRRKPRALKKTQSISAASDHGRGTSPKRTLEEPRRMKRTVGRTRSSNELGTRMAQDSKAQSLSSTTDHGRKGSPKRTLDEPRRMRRTVSKA